MRSIEQVEKARLAITACGWDHSLRTPTGPRTRLTTFSLLCLIPDSLLTSPRRIFLSLKGLPGHAAAHVLTLINHVGHDGLWVHQITPVLRIRQRAEIPI